MGRFCGARFGLVLIRRGLLLLFLLLSFSGCTLDSRISSLGVQTPAPEIDFDPPLPELKTSALPRIIPEGLPYRGVALMENVGGAVVYSLHDNTCVNLQIDSATGVLTGLLPHRSSDNCSYKVKALVDGGEEYTSSSIELNFTDSLRFSFDRESVILQKGQQEQILRLNITPAPPFDTDIEYGLFSTLNGSVDLLPGLSEKGTLSLSAGSISKEISLRLPSDSTLMGIEHQVLAVQTGSSVDKVQAKLNMVVTSPPVFSAVAAGGGAHLCH